MEDIVAYTQYFGTFAEGLALLASIVFYPKYGQTALKYLPYILGYMFVLELFAMDIWRAIGYNAIFYNVFNSAFFLFFFYVFFHFLTRKTNKKLVLVITALFLGTLLYDLYMLNFIVVPLLHSYIAGGCFIIICVVLYFLELLNSPRVLNIRQDLMFWFGAGLLLFYVGYIPIKITRLAFSTTDNTFLFLRIVHQILIVILYGCFTAGLLWKKRN